MAAGRQDDIINQHEWRVVGMSRSGNHAIINWLLAQTPGRTCFLNCAEPKNNPFCEARPLDSGLPYIADYPEFDLEREWRGEFTAKDYLIHSYEDCFLGTLRGKPSERQREAWVGRSADRRDILILRDPFNLFASRMKLGVVAITWGTTVRMWKQHAREFLGIRHYLRHDPVCVSYNAWVRQKQYRRQLAEQLGLSFNDARFGRVAEAAGGSSFDGLKFRHRASAMKVLDRWKPFIDDEDYRRLFDEEILALSEAIFGRLPAAEHFDRTKPCPG